MHYNLHQRLKPKKHLPYKKLILAVAIVLVVIAVYVLFLRNNGTPTPNLNKPT